MGCWRGALSATPGKSTEKSDGPAAHVKGFDKHHLIIDFNNPPPKILDGRRICHEADVRCCHGGGKIRNLCLIPGVAKKLLLHPLCNLIECSSHYFSLELSPYQCDVPCRAGGSSGLIEGKALTGAEDEGPRACRDVNVVHIAGPVVNQRRHIEES